MYPKISIVTPSFNDARFLESTILSVTGQGYPNLEYIVIDGGSSDNSVDIIKRYEHKITYWVSETDAGMYHAIQKGFERSTGEVMGWINSDDVLHPGSLFTIGQLFSDFQDVHWVQGIPNVIDERGRIVGVYSRPEINKLFFYKKNSAPDNYIQQESTFWRRYLWNKAGRYVSNEYRYAGDFELWLRFFQHAKLYNIKTLLGAFRVSNSGQASIDNIQAYVDETQKILDRYPLTIPEKRKLKRLRFVDYLDRRMLLMMRRIRYRMRANDGTTSNEAISFDFRAQKFKIKL